MCLQYKTYRIIRDFCWAAKMLLGKEGMRLYARELYTLRRKIRERNRRETEREREKDRKKEKERDQTMRKHGNIQK